MGKETGLICTGESVKGFLDSRKTQTRRVIRPQPVWKDKEAGQLLAAGWSWSNKNRTSIYQGFSQENLGEVLVEHCPYGVVGDRVFVQEMYQIQAEHCTTDGLVVEGIYLADDTYFQKTLTEKESEKFTARKKPYARTSGRFMYKSLARIWREITGIRIERVQDISEEDERAEGIAVPHGWTINGHKRCTFGLLWDSINAERGYSWDKNPWNWVLEVKRISDGN